MLISTLCYTTNCAYSHRFYAYKHTLVYAYKHSFLLNDIREGQPAYSAACVNVIGTSPQMQLLIYNVPSARKWSCYAGFCKLRRSACASPHLRAKGKWDMPGTWSKLSAASLIRGAFPRSHFERVISLDLASKSLTWRSCVNDGLTLFRSLDGSLRTRGKMKSRGGGTKRASLFWGHVWQDRAQHTVV